MIPRNKPRNQTRTYFTNPMTLLDKLHLGTEQVNFSEQACDDFHFKVPQAYVDKIRIGDKDDPLLKQILPIIDETHAQVGFSDDPLDEANSLLQPGLLRKYHARALLLVTPSCAINCRYCFRRHYPYEDKGYLGEQLKKNLQLIAQDSSINEIILSGGDPLSLSNSKLAELFTLIEAIPHIKRLRIHTRFPIVEPTRINHNFLKLLSHVHLPLIMVLHINHAQELGSDNQASIAKLHQQGITLFNQSVLLKGVNDNVETLTELSEQLIQHHIIPYYLHTLDKIRGSQHFSVPEKEIETIYQALRNKLPGYLLPRLVTEVPGESSKVPFVLTLGK